MLSIPGPDILSLSAGLLIGRVVLGGLMMGHGAQKLFGWFGGHGLQATGGFFETLGFRPGRLFAGLAAGTEMLGGLLLLLGLFTPVAAALMISVMIVAAGSVHWKGGLFAATNGIEVPLLYAVGALAIGLAGAGRFSLDALLGTVRLWTPMVTLLVLMLGIAGGFANLALRRPAPVPEAATQGA
ncbi:MAG TPA: DoxX family protein [Gemmatimonadales bacterium]|jgi:putative oxidoreductase|nr:DoxX family protein [Gemmatimonadales bacterium]